MTNYDGITYTNQTVTCDLYSTFTNCIWNNNWNSDDFGIMVTINDIGCYSQNLDILTTVSNQVENIKFNKTKCWHNKLLAEQQRKEDLRYKHKIKRRIKIELRRKSKAEYKAMELLTNLLEPDQIEVYKKTGRVLIKGNEFDWLIERYKQCHKEEFTPYDNVHIKKIKKDKIYDLCISQHKQMELPSTDKVIGFALMAKANETAFNKEANVIGINSYQEKEAAIM